MMDQVFREYKSRFGTDPMVRARAPGRVNLIGEHTDYNDGLVLPFAIDRATYVAAGPGPADRITACSLGRNESVTFPLRVSEPASQKTWQNYLRGVTCALRRAGIEPGGVQLCIGGDLPGGGGLSSSAALSVATALALTALAGVELTRLEVAYLAQGAEHEFAGTPCGLMDPFASVFGRAGHAVLLDCRDNTHEYVMMNLIGARLLLIDSGVRHDLADGAYRLRVRECRRAVRQLAAMDPTIYSLRDLDVERLGAFRRGLDPVAFRRADHVVGENERVRHAVRCLRTGDVQELGEWLSQSHDSLRDGFEVSCPEIEAIIGVLGRCPDVLGARMIGGGFGGMVLALTIDGAQGEIAERLQRDLRPRADRPPRVFEVAPAPGAYCRQI